ncbi:fructose 1,6-bisphosphatase [Microbacterium betulae]|uniref:Fructose 1,6-bisphosphatase n=1 Tax=Microbacterium betulae TaxID=2981139 RepID=A0AA97I463_9MICO|nr:fructose 1,6-bisphosphatase [Microbacterium sp. AB]WOF22276.1 fructose 1,6-bisphosphatase [Microbacterium sp. AB]
MSASIRRALIRSAAVATLLATASLTAGCTQVLSAIEAQAAVERSPAPSSAGTGAPLESAFTDDGSVSLTSDVADDLEVRIDVWAADPKRTEEWTASADKAFGFAVNVYDYRVAEKSVLADKRRVYLSQVSITSTLSPDRSAGSFQLTVDPRTLVPADTLRSDRGLLLNSYQGGLLVPETIVSQLPAGTTGITLEFALTLSAEGAASDDDSFQQQTVYQTLPIRIFPDASDG